MRISPNRIAPRPLSPSQPAPSPLKWDPPSAQMLPGHHHQSLELFKLADAVRTGALVPAQLGALIEKIPKPSPREAWTLGRSEGSDARHEHVVAWKALAAAAPQARLAADSTGVRTPIREQALKVEFENALFDGNASSGRAVAAQLAKQFPSSPSLPLILAQAKRL